LCVLYRYSYLITGIVMCVNIRCTIVRNVSLDKDLYLHSQISLTVTVTS